ncbi:transcription antitermination factor NusB [Candidatus Dependentiae bacterium]|nr:transcription antitermination factor NusB [Candidatus Dependentiae bacterium]
MINKNIDPEIEQQSTETNEITDSELTPRTQRAQRSFAFHILYAMDRNDYAVPLSFILDDFRTGFDVEFSDDCFAVSIAKGVLEHQQEIDSIVLSLLENWSADRLGCCTTLILRIAFWELLYTKTPPQIVINEAIELTKAFAEKDAHRFVNGVLDTYCTRANIKIENPFKTPKAS